MGSRKEFLKRSLGITEYPWTSDDEIDESLTRMEAPAAAAPRRQSEPRASTADMPGTSGLQQQSATPQNQATAVADATAPHKRRQARLDRDLFWSIVNHNSTPVRLTPPVPLSSQNAPTVRARMQLMIPGPQRIVHTPAADYRDRNSNRSNTTMSDIQRMLTFKRLTRNVNALRLNSGQYSMSSRGNPGVTVPSETTSTLRISRPHRTSYKRYTPMHIVPGFSRSRSLNEVSGEQFTHVRPSESTQQDASTSTAQIRVNIRLHPSNEEQETPAPSTTAPINGVTNFVQDESSRQMPLDNENGVALEEEIVEIDPEDAAQPDETFDIEDDNVEDDNNGTEEMSHTSQDVDPNLASTSRDTPEPQPQAQIDNGVQTDHEVQTNTGLQTNQGVKRKRRDSEENAETYTVKEFNQELLRLLECPVCLEWMEPPMSQCRRGHLVCGRCRARLAACPVCRTSFSSVRNRAMEGVAEMLRYPCRHGCGRALRLRRRTPHEASCAARHYACPAPACRDAAPLPRHNLGQHFQSKHMQMLKIGNRHKFSIKLNIEQHENWLMLALDEYFHLRIDVDIRLVVYVVYIGPKCDSKFYNYVVSIDGQHCTRKLVYTRSTHSDLESPSLNMNRQDCFYITIDQALNFIRVKNRHCDADKLLDFTVEITKTETPPVKDESDS